MMTKSRKAYLPAVALISLTLLSACSPAETTVKPTTASPSASATPTSPQSSSPTSTPTLVPPMSVPVETTPEPQPAPVAADKVTITPDNLRIVDDGVETAISYEEAPQSAIDKLTNLLGSEPAYRYFDNEDCKFDLSEYTWNGVTVSFEGKDTATQEGFMLNVDNSTELPFEVVTRSGIHIGDSLDSALASIDENSPTINTGDDYDSSSTFAALLDGYRGDVVTEKAVAEGTFVAFNDNVANRISSPYFLFADC